MNFMNEHVLYSLSKERQQRWRDEAARDHAIREALNHRPGFILRLHCQILLSVAGYLMRIGKRMEKIALALRQPQNERGEPKALMAIPHR